MDILQLRDEGKRIWGTTLTLPQIITRMGKVFGDICKWERNEGNDRNNDDELKKELGNIIFSTIRWCDDLGYNPEECIKLAMKAQREYVAKRMNK